MVRLTRRPFDTRNSATLPLRLHPRVPVARYQDGFVDQAGIYFKVPQDLNGQELILDAEQENSFLTLDVNNVNSSDHVMEGESYIRIGQPNISYQSKVYIHSDDHASTSWEMSEVTISSGSVSVIDEVEGIRLRTPSYMRWNTSQSVTLSDNALSSDFSELNRLRGYLR